MKKKQKTIQKNLNYLIQQVFMSRKLNTNQKYVVAKKIKQ